jgi:rod shape-determining protein MreC
LNRFESSHLSRLLGQDLALTARACAYALLAIILMVLDARGGYVSRIRDLSALVLEPVFHVVSWPPRLAATARSHLASKAQLRTDNERLQRAALLHAGEVQRLQALERENLNLRSLLDTAESRNFNYQFAQMLQVSLDPYAHQVMIDQGVSSGVFDGQAVIDGQGIMGQVESAQLHVSRVRLISDPDHALPVQILVGDLLITSGLGDRFPPGFPVAVVESVERPEGAAFARLLARPLAALGRGSELLLIQPVVAPESRGEEPPEEARYTTGENRK